MHTTAGPALLLQNRQEYIYFRLKYAYCLHYGETPCSVEEFLPVVNILAQRRAIAQRTRDRRAMRLLATGLRNQKWDYSVARALFHIIRGKQENTQKLNSLAHN